ncbi:MAG: PIN domain-containing protein [Promethearchaeota archaeon]
MDNNEYIFHISMIIPIEVGCSIARRVGIKESNDSIEILDNWIKEHKIKIYELNEKRMQEAEKCGLQFKLRGMDSIIVQLTKELNLPLITFDNEIINRAKEIEFYK